MSLGSTSHRWPAVIATALFAWAAIGHADEAVQVKPLLFGVLNQQSPIQTGERWNPILHYLTERTGIPLQLKMGATVQLTDAMMGREEFDLVFTNHNFQSQYDGKYQVLVRWGGKPIQGVVAVLQESPLRAIQDLQGLEVAFPSTDAFVAYAVPQTAFKAHGISVSERFAGNQEGAMAQLQAKQVSAAAVNSRFLEQYARREPLRYRVIYASEPYHELPVLAHPRLGAQMLGRLRDTLVGMRHDPEAAAILKAANCPGFEEASEQDYHNVRRVYQAIGK